MHGYVIKAEHDMIQIINENCQLAHLRYGQIDSKVPIDRSRILRDSRNYVI